MRVALFPASGNPYVLKLWLRSFERFWKHEVDKLYATVSFPMEQPVMQYVSEQLLGAGAEVVPVPDARRPLQHGEALALLLEQCPDGLGLLIEEDCFVLMSGEIGRCFGVLEAEGLRYRSIQPTILFRQHGGPREAGVRAYRRGAELLAESVLRQQGDARIDR